MKGRTLAPCILFQHAHVPQRSHITLVSSAEMKELIEHPALMSLPSAQWLCKNCSECFCARREPVGWGLLLPACPECMRLLSTLRQMQGFAYWKYKEGFFSSESCLFFRMYWHQNGKCLFLKLAIYKQPALPSLVVQGGRDSCSFTFIVLNSPTGPSDRSKQSRSCWPSAGDTIQHWQLLVTLWSYQTPVIIYFNLKHFDCAVSIVYGPGFLQRLCRRN